MGAITRTFANQIKTGGKLDADGLDLTDTFAFTGTVTGAGGITMVDQFALTSTFSLSDGANQITANLARVNNGENPGFIGTGMTESSGIFTFPSTGYYLIDFVSSATANTATSYVITGIQATTNNSSYSTILIMNPYITNSYVTSMSGTQLIDVTDTSNVKIRFITHFSQSNSQVYGSTTFTYTGATFIRLGDT